MEIAPKPLLVGKRASVSEAKFAYFEGDFERCLEICANIRMGSVATASEVALLTARAFLRTGRAREAQNTIVDSLDNHRTLDASLTAQMLVATARIRQDDPDTGIAILADAASRAADAHFAVRSEIAFSTALGYWAKREIDTAESYLALVDPRTDIIHARALDLQAWCYTARRDYRRSAEAFQAALVRLDECQAHDRTIAATAISTLAIYAAELFDRDMAHFVDVRAQNIDWSSGVTVQHYLTLAHQALFHEFDGNTVQAYQLATQAREHAPTAAFEVLGWGLSSAIARNAGERHSAIVFAKRAQQVLETIEEADLVGEERFALLAVAENCAHFEPERAAALCARYFGLAPVDKMVVMSSDPRLTADETFIAGVIAQAQSEHARAEACYRQAFEIFKSVGYLRRALHCAHAILQISPDANLHDYIATHLAARNNYVTAALARGNGRLADLERHPIVATLPAAQREVVTLLCLGKTNKEIAELRHVGEQTIKNMLTKHVFRAFGVTSRAALVSACLRNVK